MVRMPGSEGLLSCGIPSTEYTVPGSLAPTPSGRVLGPCPACPLKASASLALCVLGCQEGDLTVGHASHVPAGRAVHTDPRRQADLLPSVPCLWTSLLWCQAGIYSPFPLFPTHPSPCLSHFPILLFFNTKNSLYRGIAK